MKLEARFCDVDSSEPMVLLHDDDCLEIGVKENDRVSISGTKSTVALVSKSDTLVEKGTVLLPPSLMSKCAVEEGDTVNVQFAPKPDSVRSIRRKMDGEKLDKEEIVAIVEDILDNRLSKIEISAWLTALYINGMDIDEIAWRWLIPGTSSSSTGNRFSISTAWEGYPETRSPRSWCQSWHRPG